MIYRKFSAYFAFTAIFGSCLLASCKGGAVHGKLPFPFAKVVDNNQISTSESSMSAIQLPTNRVNAPEFPRDFAWVNTDRPLYIKEQLKGRVVILDFWTYCCINCMHILPDLEFIEEKYAKEPVAVIGVHSAKFDNESDEQNIRTACHRYNIGHPVIVDQSHRIWSEYTVNSWPTLMVIDPEGRVVGSLSGEGNREVLDQVISALLAEGRDKSTLASGPPEFQRNSRVPSASGLAFPGKVLAVPGRNLIVISDSNHDRVIMADTTGRVIMMAGSGKKGATDGKFNNAQFNNPQGAAFDEVRNVLYIADTDNHVIRKLDLSNQTVETICGTGEQVYDRSGGRRGRDQGLNSPWDLVLADNVLYIAMAGPHQLWTLNLETMIAAAWAGSGREDIIDGSARAAALAQPSGLARKGDWLYFADSEVSALRRANLKDGHVETLIGSGLFDFGDRDGLLKSALLQHPLGVAIHGEDVLVADTYNHKIKRVNELSKSVVTIAGDGDADPIARAYGNLSLYEPGGLSVDGNWLYIADTNHDRIIKLDLNSGAWAEFALRGLSTSQMLMTSFDQHDAEVVKIPPAGDVTLSITAEFPNGIHLNAEAPINYAIKSAGSSESTEGVILPPKMPVEIKVPRAMIRPREDLLVSLFIAYCTDGNRGLCVPVSLHWKLRPNVVEDGHSQVSLKQAVKSLSNG